ncbi:ABC transporter permease [Sphaerisporangium viridialbum]|uniref:ABC transporter permease n=1 Tax=Sphaerisporangium viridialbum TaxID=46189 RepID=UPI003C738454
MSVMQFALLGLGLGGAYALLALGLVAIYRGTGVLNFSHGAVAMISAYVFFALRDDLGWSVLPSSLVTLVFAGVLGLAFYLAVMRQLRNSPVLARIIATLALLLLLQGLATVLFDVQTKTPISVVSSTPIVVLGVNLPMDRLILAAIAVVLAAVLAVVSRRTRIGLAVRAISDSEKGASLSGLSPVLIGALTWAVGFVLAAIAGVMLSPIAGLDAKALTLLVVPVFAAALLARFTSFGIAVAAGLGLGMVESALQLVTGAEGSWYTWLWTGPGRSQALPALVVILAMIFSGRLLPARGEVVRGRLPISLPPRYRVIGPIIALAIGLVFIYSARPSWLSAGVVSLAGILIALSVVMVTGFVGQISLAQVAFAGIGGMMTAILSSAGVPFLLVILLSGVIALLVGLLVGLPSLRVRGPSLALVTLSAAFVCQVAVFSDGRLLGGKGYNRVAPAGIFGYELSDTGFAVFVLVVVIAAAALLSALRVSTPGRRALAVRENEAATVAAGINIKHYKLAAFALSAFIAGVGGSLLGYQANVFSYERFTVFESLNVIVMAYIGGIGMVSGAIIAGLGAGGGLFSQLLAVGGLDDYHLIIAGGALLISVQLHPDGMASLAHTFRGRRARGTSEAGPAPAEPASKAEPAPPKR